MVQGVDCDETFSPHAKMATYRIFLTLVANYSLNNPEAWRLLGVLLDEVSTYRLVPDTILNSVVPKPLGTFPPAVVGH